MALLSQRRQAGPAWKLYWRMGHWVQPMSEEYSPATQLRMVTFSDCGTRSG
jgi:hypothetical protein